MTRFIISICLFCIFFQASTALYADDEIILTDRVEFYPLEQHLQLLFDPSLDLDIDEIDSEARRDQFQKYNYSKKGSDLVGINLWIRLDLVNNSSRKEWVIEQDISYMSFFDIYLPAKDGGWIKNLGGGLRPYAARFFDYEFLNHKIEIEPGERKTIYLMCYSDVPVTMNLNISSPGKLLGRSTMRQFLLGIYYGIVLVLFIYSLFNYMALRNKSYLFYGLYILFIAFMLASIDGKIYRYIVPDSPILNLQILNIVLTLGAFFAILYARSFLNIPKNLPLYDTLLKAALIILLITILLIPWTPYKFLVMVSRIIPIPAMTLVIIAGIISIRKKYPPARLFVAGFGIFMVGATFSFLVFEGVLVTSSTRWTYAIHAGSALEAIILVFALSQQMRLMKKEAEASREKIIQQLKENEMLQKKVNLELEQKVRERTHEIEQQKEQIEQKNKDITDSINYAQRIQQAILPPQKLVMQHLKESFILYKPKDIIAGDFYWLEAFAPPKVGASASEGKPKEGITPPSGGGEAFFAAADCTGHGVPGAMVSVVCHNALNRSVREFGLTKPGEILDKTRELVIETFEKSEEEVKDGMDIALCSLTAGGLLQYTGANAPLWIIPAEPRNNLLDFKNYEGLYEIRPDKQPIGKHEDPKPFTNHTVQLQKGDAIYIFSDGFADQFGGPKGKKFKYKAFKELLLSIQDKPMKDQKQIIDEAFEQWRGSLEQVDDVCVIGVRI